MSDRRKNLFVLLPTVGSIAFIILYFISAALYPGGSEFNRSSKGFDWIRNYWCNLLDDFALNNAVNNGRYYARTAMVILCFSIGFFFYYFPKKTLFSRSWKIVLQTCGILSMISLAGLFTGFHDETINVAGAFGLVALAGVYAGLFKSREYLLFWFGIFNLLLIAANNYIYYTKDFFYTLAVVQKISFLSFLIWMCMINIQQYQEDKK